MEDVTAFIEKVRAMRETQKEFFKTRDGKVMLKARQLEKEVDAALERMERPTVPEKAPVAQQGSLF